MHLRMSRLADILADVVLHRVETIRKMVMSGLLPSMLLESVSRAPMPSIARTLRPQHRTLPRRLLFIPDPRGRATANPWSRWWTRISPQISRHTNANTALYASCGAHRLLAPIEAPVERVLTHFYDCCRLRKRCSDQAHRSELLCAYRPAIPGGLGESCTRAAVYDAPD